MPVSDFQAAIRELQSEQVRSNRVRITYRQGNTTTLAFDCARGESRHEVQNWEQTVFVPYESDDFLIYTKDLLTRGVSKEPQKGDRILVQLPDGTSEEYEVHPTPDNKTFRYTDPFHEMYRVHTKRVNNQK